MENWVPRDFWLNAGGWLSALGLVLFLTLRGLLVPKKTVDWSQEHYKERIQEKDKQIEKLETALTTEQSSVNLLSQNQDKLLQALDLNNSLIEAVHNALRRQA